MDALITFWSHALAAACFAALMIWRLGEAARQPAQRLLAGAFALTACWAWLGAMGSGEPIFGFAETARNLLWISLLYSLSAAGEEREHGLKLVYGAVAAVIGLQLIGDTLQLFSPSGTIAQTGLVLRVTTAAGALILVHNVYGQAAPASRSHIRFAMLGLALIWIYDLNLYTSIYLEAAGAPGLLEWRGIVVALAAPLFALATRKQGAWRVRPSRAATFQSLSLLAICAYFALMAILTTALRGTGVDWSSTLMIGALAVMTVGAMVLIPSARARGWVKLKLAKHLFEHRYDYRTEWLRFTQTLGLAGPEAPPLSERIVRAFADIVDAPGAMLLVSDGGRSLSVATASEWPGSGPGPDAFADSIDFWTALEASGRVVEFAGLRGGWAGAEDKTLGVPQWLLDEPKSWAAIPLLHHQRLVGVVVLSAPDYRRQLDWEDFDLLRTAGNQAASSLAEALSQEALGEAQRFEEFNRRFAFILHDIKNLVSQLSLVARNAERHADNPEFRADMVATLQSSVGKMKELLTRLAPHATGRVQRIEPQPLRPILTNAIAGKRRDREVTLLGDASISALVDSNALEQAVGHLLQNALDASSGEPVAVRVGCDGISVSIAITDKGVGMDGDFIRNRLFQPFASTKPGGFGIGAFEARSLITAMDGRISVDSRPGRGTTFTILLPAALAAAQQQRKIA
ncbi:XrtA/PEP-CTERM system histidine kinase PrsK [Sphingomonas sp.]|uniref:XrtA/PEP-CTERM system histidine kinase PrsK n=1 Tax=Sphingomonas sp. TaxID=28214 RepID=UPI00389FD50F